MILSKALNSHLHSQAQQMKGRNHMEQDWRLHGQEEYLQNAVLYRVVFPDFWNKAYADKNEFYQSILKYAEDYVKSFPDRIQHLDGESVQGFWHEHCEFCWDKAMTNIECEFYCTKDMRYWICKECFFDFKDAFGWTVKSAEDLFV